MFQGKYVFSQVMDTIVRYQFNQCVARYRGEYWVKRFSCWEQFLAMAFGQLTHRESLRDVVVCLNSKRDALYHIGFRSMIARATLAEANEHRDWRIYRDLAQVLIQQARNLYVGDKLFNLDLNGTVYILDSTTIDLCLSVFPWATFRTTKAAVKLHTLMDLQGNIPTFFHISKGNEHDVHFLDRIIYEVGAYYVMDRGYLDYARLHTLHLAGAFFVTRAKDNLAAKRLYSNQVDKVIGVRCDQVIRLSSAQAHAKYPDKLRRVKYFDQETNRYYVFLTNDFNVGAKTIADLYKHRWQIELFFKWIKQHLKIQSFWGYSTNAVKTQICIAISTYLIVAIMSKQLQINRNLYEILQILSVTPFDKTPITTLVSEFDLRIFDDQAQKLPFLLGY
ncbi:MAG: IS4 family transposase [bacterium]|nr:IS4 family transposase [bacterium]